MKKPTDRELAAFLKKVTGRMRSMPYTDRDVRIVRIAYKDADRFELHWRDPARRKLRYRNWRHALAAAMWVNEKLEEARGKTAFTFDDAADAWLKHQELRVRAGDLAPHTVLVYTYHLEHARKRFGKMLLRDIQSRHIQTWLLELAQEYKFGTLNGRRDAVVAVLKHAVEWQMLDVNPLAVMPVRVPGRNDARRDAPDRSDMQALARYLRGPRPFKFARLSWSGMRAAIALGSIGLRIGEVCGLRWERINPHTGDITIREVITGRPNPRVKATPKTRAGVRTIPTHPSVRQILNEHAMVYKEFFGECVGFVVRYVSPRSGLDFMIPHDLSDKFARILKHAGIVDQDGKPKYVFHQLRHWAASDLIRHVDIHHTKTWLGHKHASTTLDVYGHMIDDPDGRKKIEQIPSWLDEPIELNAQGRPVLPAPAPAQNGELSELAPQPDTPIDIPEWAERWVAVFVRELWSHGNVARAFRAIGKSRSQVRYELQRCGLPTIAELETIALTVLGGAEPIDEDEAIEVVAPAPARQSCPIDLPESAAGWLAPFIRLIDQGLTWEAACQRIHKGQMTVLAELRRCKVAKSVSQLKRRLRHKKIMALYDQGHQDRDIVRLVGSSLATVHGLRSALRKPNASKRLENKVYQPAPAKPDARPEHKKQLKLL